jgi:hypothetical protein
MGKDGVTLKDHATAAVRLSLQRLAIKQNGAATRRFLAQQQTQEGRFPAAGCAHH